MFLCRTSRFSHCTQTRHCTQSGSGNARRWTWHFLEPEPHPEPTETPCMVYRAGPPVSRRSDGQSEAQPTAIRLLIPTSDCGENTLPALRPLLKSLLPAIPVPVPSAITARLARLARGSAYGARCGQNGATPHGRWGSLMACLLSAQPDLNQRTHRAPARGLGGSCSCPP